MGRLGRKPVEGSGTLAFRNFCGLSSSYKQGNPLPHISMASHFWRRALACGAALMLFGLPIVQAADSFQDVESRISEFTLKNGMKFIVLERHQAPVASFYTYADVGSAQEVKGITGLAHMFEHMAFK